MIEHYNELVYYIYRMVGDKEKAKDIIQEAYSRMLVIDKRTPVKNKRAFLYKLARNIAIDQARREKNASSIIYEEEEHSIPIEEQPEEQVCQANQQELLLQILATLPEKNQQAFTLHILEGFSRKEIAEKMGVSVGAVEKHIIRASEKLKEKMQRKLGIK
ncbi:RNA polymerase subunit sigma [Halarcobacter mediterraneus]|uniref:RNA polymerase subunit sigma n=1 Tax=Halarcobacter mediterraneus TaxID=2023153 RepID=A0A4V1M1E9_9BACT|nr:RNA polymerase sigma factor [Halarcobacter mediterraneus]RXK13424.1 RNA polymerase subunit sigma [Halarcobacter mediterraneus]